MDKIKRRHKRKNKKLTNHLAVIIICIISIFAGFFIGRITSSSSEISSLEKSNIENEATLKTFYRENNHIRLQPENDEMEPIIVDNCSILGKLIGIYRTY